MQALDREEIGPDLGFNKSVWPLGVGVEEEARVEAGSFLGKGHLNSEETQ